MQFHVVHPKDESLQVFYNRQSLMAHLKTLYPKEYSDKVLSWFDKFVGLTEWAGGGGSLADLFRLSYENTVHVWGVFVVGAHDA